MAADGGDTDQESAVTGKSMSQLSHSTDGRFEKQSCTDQIRVLYVEDDPNFAELAVTCLENETDRISIERAPSATNGLERLGDDTDCIVSDYNMPGMDGIEFLETVRESYPDLPFILFTGKGSEEVASDAISAGVTDYLQKESGTDQFTVLANRIANVVEKERVQEQLAQQNEQLDTVLSHSPLISFAFDADGVFTLSRGKALSKLGLAPGEVVGESVFDVFADNPDIVAAAESALDGEQTSATHEVGGAVYQTTYNPVFAEDGTVSTVTGVAIDITERHEREQELRQFKEAIEATSHSVYITDTDGTIEYVNPTFEELTGYTAEEAVGRTPCLLKSGEHGEEFYEELWNTILAGDTWEGELVNSAKNGDRYVINQTITPVTDDAGEITNFVAVNTDITERRQRERRFRALVEESNDVISVLDADGVFQYNSPSLERILGYDPTETIGDTAWEYIHPEDREAVIETFEEWRTNPGTTATVEYRAQHADGSWHWMEARGTNQHGNPAIKGCVVNSRDITDRKERQREIERERYRYATLFETLPTPVLHATADDGEPVVRTVNPAFEETFGYDAETITGDPLHEYILPDGQAEAAQRLNRRLLNEGHVRTEVRRETTDGVRTFRLDCNVRNTDSEQPEGYAVYTDITDREEYERELKAERRRFRNLFEHLSQPAVELEYVDDAPIVRQVNDAFEETFGYEGADIVGESLDDFIVPDEQQEEASEINDRVQATGQLLSEEVTRQTANGLREFLLQNAVYADGSKAFAIYTDITERAERERELEILRQAIDNAHIPLVLSDPSEEGNPLVYVNDAFEEVTGYSQSEAIGRNCRFLQGEGTDPDQVATLREAIDNEEEVTVQLRNHRKDGEMFWNRLTVRPIYDEDGSLLRFFGSQQDITERKESKERLERQNDRLAEFAQTVSHDLRNPLQVADARLELASEECDSEHLNAVADAVDRSKTLIDDLLTLARNGIRVEETEPVELAGAVKQCNWLIKAADTSLAIETEQTLVADLSRLRQLVENLLRNAVEHGDDGVDITVGELHERSGFYIADDGPGIPNEEREQVFESGYSTADDGTGFGLAIVQEIVREHGWEISVTDSQSGGTRFEITGVELAAE